MNIVKKKLSSDHKFEHKFVNFTHALEIHISLVRYGLLSSNPHSTFSQIFPSGVAAKKKENIFLQLNHNLKNVNWLPHLCSTHIQLLLF